SRHGRPSRTFRPHGAFPTFPLQSPCPHVSPQEDLLMAPFELTLFSFLDASAVEQPFTTTDPEAAWAHAARHRLVVLRNSYEFVSSEPVADFTGAAVVIAGK